MKGDFDYLYSLRFRNGLICGVSTVLGVGMLGVAALLKEPVPQVASLSVIPVAAQPNRYAAHGIG